MQRDPFAKEIHAPDSSQLGALAIPGSHPAGAVLFSSVDTTKHSNPGRQKEPEGLKTFFTGPHPRCTKVQYLAPSVIYSPFAAKPQLQIVRLKATLFIRGLKPSQT